MSIRFEWDEQGLKRAMEQWATEAIRSVVADAQPKLDAVFDAHQRQLVEEVIPPLRETMTEMDWTFTDEELRAYAEAISGANGSFSLRRMSGSEDAVRSPLIPA
jgi:L-lactate utilization protein LutC